MTATDALSAPAPGRPAATLAAPTAPTAPIMPADLAAARLPLVVWIYLFTIVVPISFYAGPLLMTTLRVFLILLVVPLAIGLIAGRYGRVILTDLLFVLHVLWTVVSLAVNNPDQVIQQTGSVGAEFIGGYLLGRAYIRTPQAFVALCRALVLIVCLTLPFALYETQTGRPPIIDFITSLPGIFSLAVVNIDIRLGLERVQAVFAHPIHYGLFCSVAFSLSFVALKDITSPVRRYVVSAVVGGCGLLALSSGALLAIALQIALITWASLFAKVRARWWLLLGLFALAYVVVALLSNRPPIRVFMSYATFSAHTAFWRGIIFEWGMMSVWGHPLFGIGLNDWVRPDFMPSASVDNFWLLMAMRYGIPGFLLVAVGYGVAVVRVMRRNFEGDEMLTQFRRAWVFTFVGLSFTLVTVHIWTNVYSFVFFMFGAGMWFIHAFPGDAAVAPARRSAPTAWPTGLPEAVTDEAADAVGADGATADGAAPQAVSRPVLSHSRFATLRRRGGPSASVGEP